MKYYVDVDELYPDYTLVEIRHITDESRRTGKDVIELTNEEYRSYKRAREYYSEVRQMIRTKLNQNK